MWEQQCAAFQPLCPNRDSVDHTLKHSADYNSAAEKHWCGIKRSKQLKWDDGDVKREWKCQGGVWVDDTHTYTQRERKHQNKNQSKKTEAPGSSCRGLLLLTSTERRGHEWMRRWRQWTTGWRKRRRRKRRCFKSRAVSLRFQAQITWRKIKFTSSRTETHTSGGEDLMTWK